MCTRLCHPECKFIGVHLCQNNKFWFMTLCNIIFKNFFGLIYNIYSSKVKFFSSVESGNFSMRVNSSLTLKDGILWTPFSKASRFFTNEKNRCLYINESTLNFNIFLDLASESRVTHHRPWTNINRRRTSPLLGMAGEN